MYAYKYCMCGPTIISNLFVCCFRYFSEAAKPTASNTQTHTHTYQKSPTKYYLIDTSVSVAHKIQKAPKTKQLKKHISTFNICCVFVYFVVKFLLFKKYPNILIESTQCLQWLLKKRLSSSKYFTPYILNIIIINRNSLHFMMSVNLWSSSRICKPTNSHLTNNAHSHRHTHIDLSLSEFWSICFCLSLSEWV